ncbi:hypothetical protein ACWKWN_14940 [Microbacterium trichothecenolyticum]
MTGASDIAEARSRPGPDDLDQVSADASATAARETLDYAARPAGRP